MGKQPNVLFLMMDDTQKDCLGCYQGGGEVLTPHLNALAAEGVRFERAYCSSTVCTPSRYTFMTGHYAGRNTDPVFLKDNPPGDMSNIHFNVVLNEQTPNLMSVLKDNGYQTGYVGKWHCGRSLADIGAPSFSADEDPRDPETDQKVRQLQRILQHELKCTLQVDHARSLVWGNVDEMPLDQLKAHHLEWMTQGALEVIDSLDADKPFALYMATSSFHGPSHDESLDQDPCLTWSGYDPAMKSVGEERRAIKETLKARGMAIDHRRVGAYWTDLQFGKVMQRLEEKGLLDHTIIVYASDHNVEPGKASCYEFGTRIPLLIRWPDGFGKGQVSHDLVQNIDLVPTLLRTCGVEAPRDMVLDGKDIRSILNGEDRHDSLYFEMGFLRAVLKDDMKYIALRYPKSITEAVKAGSLHVLPNHLDMSEQHQPYVTMDVYRHALDSDQLYDLSQDPAEQHNLADDPAYAEKREELQLALQRYVGQFRLHPYDLKDREIFSLDAYDRAKSRLQARGLEPVPWWTQEDSEEARQRIPKVLKG
ncbi:sulfatase family protein [Marinicrinis sediminis]|uniref:Sulfatase n=1 Tax=Marinicrinis sediminis TaxID=1652465 RepID=A0ABW5RAP0_9BACL